MIKFLKKYQVQLTPFTATKNWALNNTDNSNLWLMEDEYPVALEFLDYGDGSELPFTNSFCNIALEQQDNDLAIVEDGLYVTGSFYPDIDPTNPDGTYQRTIYHQVRTMFYNLYVNPTKIWGIENIDFELSKTQRILTDQFRLFNIPRMVFGEKMTPNTVIMTDNRLDNPYTVEDDGYGNMVAGTNIFSHQQEVGYYPNNFDATLSSDGCDYYWPTTTTTTTTTPPPTTTTTTPTTTTTTTTPTTTTTTSTTSTTTTTTTPTTTTTTTTTTTPTTTTTTPTTTTTTSTTTTTTTTPTTTTTTTSTTTTTTSTTTTTTTTPPPQTCDGEISYTATAYYNCLSYNATWTYTQAVNEFIAATGGFIGGKACVPKPVWDRYGVCITTNLGISVSVVDVSCICGANCFGGAYRDCDCWYDYDSNSTEVYCVTITG